MVHVEHPSVALQDISKTQVFVSALDGHVALLYRMDKIKSKLTTYKLYEFGKIRKPQQRAKVTVRRKNTTASFIKHR